MPRNSKRSRSSSINSEVGAIGPTDNDYLYKKPRAITSIYDFALCGLIDIECKLNNVEDAQNYLEKLSALIKQYNLIEKVPDIIPLYYSRKAEILILQNKLAQAMGLLNEAEKQLPQDEFLKAFILSQKGKIKKQQNSYESAMNYFNKALDCDFDNDDFKIEILKLLAAVEAKVNLLDKAWQHITQARALNTLNNNREDAEIYSISAEICLQTALKKIKMMNATPATDKISQGQSFCLYKSYKVEQKEGLIINSTLRINFSSHP